MIRLRHYAAFALLAMTAGATLAQNTPVSQMEKLDRGLVAITASASQTFLSWRFLGTDEEYRTTFDVLRNGMPVKENLYVTNYTCSGSSAGYKYQVVTKVDGVPVDTTAEVKAWTGLSKTLTLDRPESGTTESGAYTYSPNDMSVGDVDGDGQYELFVKWDPSNSKDNSQDGYTGNVIIDCYRVDWTNGISGNGDAERLWRIDLGRNIRAGAHYTQFMVYDFDGDGRAEMMLKTAPGSKDGLGNYVNQAATDAQIKAADNSKVWLSSSGRMDGGQEYLTVFNGLTGQAVHTIAYNPNRNATSTLSEEAGTFNWYGSSGKNDTHGYNRGDRYLAAVAYLDGPDKNPSGIFCRGYYTYAFVWAVDFDGQQLRPKWFSEHRSTSTYSLTTFDANGNGTKRNFNNCKPTSGSGSGTMYSNGNHNLSIADVDGDGCDEILWGSAALNNDGLLLYGTGFGHGDAIHVSDLNPDRPGLEVFQIHEEKGPYSWDIHDAHTGEILLKGGVPGVDNGRGVAADIVSTSRGFEYWSAYGGAENASARDRNPFSAITGVKLASCTPSENFRIYWDGDLQDELADGGNITKYSNGSMTSLKSLAGNTCNSTKNTPNLQADILGDWREEVILHNGADQIIIYSTTTATNYCLPTLMHDHVYRMGICWQNTAYNQPPHLGYYLPDTMVPYLKVKEYTVAVGEEFEIVAPVIHAGGITLKGWTAPDGTSGTSGVPTGMSRVSDTSYRTFKVKGTASVVGDYKIAMTLKELSKATTPVYADTLIIHAVNTTGIESMDGRTATTGRVRIYDAAGRQMPQQSVSVLPRGLYIVREGQHSKKIIVK